MDSTVGPFVAAHVSASDPTAAVWNTAVTKFEGPCPSQKVQERTSRFTDFRRRFLAQSKQPVLQQARLKPRCTIKELQDEVNGAIDEYERRGSSYKAHFVRTTGRSWSRNLSVIEGLLNFLPNGDYGSILCGALALIFNGARRLENIREMVLDCLSSLSTTVQNTKEYMLLYRGDKILWNLAENLYIALLDAAEGMLVWLDQHSSRHAMGALFKQDAYGTSVEAHKKAVEEHVSAFRDRLEYCQHERVNKIEIGQNKTLVETRDISSQQKSMQKNQERMIESWNQLFESSLREREWFFKEMESNKQFVLNLFQEALGKPQIILATGQYRPRSFINAVQLQEILRADPYTASLDLSWAISQLLTVQNHSRSARVLQNPQFQTWFRSGSSSILVINGQQPETSWKSSAGISAMTSFAALFIKSIQESKIAIPLVFFCGRHAIPDDPLEGAGGLLRSLITQLLDYYGDRLDLSFIDYTLSEKLKNLDMSSVCELFRGLLGAVISLGSQVAIVCLLDSVNLLETRARKSGLEIVIGAFQRLVQELDGLQNALLLKVILTYPDVSSTAWEWFPREAILNMNEDGAVSGDAYSAYHVMDVSQSSLAGSSNYSIVHMNATMSALESQN